MRRSLVLIALFSAGCDRPLGSGTIQNDAQLEQLSHTSEISNDLELSLTRPEIRVEELVSIGSDLTINLPTYPSKFSFPSLRSIGGNVYVRTTYPVGHAGATDVELPVLEIIGEDFYFDFDTLGRRPEIDPGSRVAMPALKSAGCVVIDAPDVTIDLSSLEERRCTYGR